MAKENLSVEEVLAACRRMDGSGAGQSAPTATPAPEAEQTDPSSSTATSSSSSTKPASRNLSVEEMLAAARAEKTTAQPAVTGQESASLPAAAKPAAAKVAKPASRSMSVEEMLAAARGEKSAAKSTAPQAAAKTAVAAASTAAAAGSKSKPKSIPKSAPPTTGPRDTSSILAAARSATKRGPISKAEAAKQGAPVIPKKSAPPMPEKPSYVKTAARPPQKDAEPRRGFFSVLFGSFLAIGFTCLSGVTALWGLGLARFMFPNILTEPPSQFKVGFPADFPPDVVVTKFKAQFGVWVVNTEYEGERMITVLQSICTHLGCTPNWLEGEQKFKCPCHGSGFYIDGINFEGPAPRPLERYAIRIADDGQLEIDKSKTFQQEMGQWNDSSSFVAV